MRLSDKIGLWADNKLSELYFNESPLKEIRKKIIGMLIPVCNHKDFETGKKCNERGEICYIPNWGDDEEEQVVWYCLEHMSSEGFCVGCRQLWAGCEDFDFDPNGLCSNCRHDPDVVGEEGEEDDYGEFYDPYEWS